MLRYLSADIICSESEARGKLWDSEEQLDNVQWQINQHIFASYGGYVVIIPQIFLNDLTSKAAL